MGEAIRNRFCFLYSLALSLSLSLALVRFFHSFVFGWEAFLWVFFFSFLFCYNTPFTLYGNLAFALQRARAWQEKPIIGFPIRHTLATRCHKKMTLIFCLHSWYFLRILMLFHRSGRAPPGFKLLHTSLKAWRVRRGVNLDKAPPCTRVEWRCILFVLFFFFWFCSME